MRNVKKRATDEHAGLDKKYCTETKPHQPPIFPFYMGQAIPFSFFTIFFYYVVSLFNEMLWYWWVRAVQVSKRKV